MKRGVIENTWVLESEVGSDLLLSSLSGTMLRI